jgi:undecaprenyl-diphosphatase
MEAYNRALFLLINAPAHPGSVMLAVATACAEYLIWSIPLFIAVAWLRGSESTRKALIEATAAGLIGLLINQVIGLAWQHPRPFMIGLGHTLLVHAPDSSFPSDHGTLIWAVAFSLCLYAGLRRAGLAFAAVGLVVAWARVYLGVHFPFDMAGAAMVALVGALLARQLHHVYMAIAYLAATLVHRVCFARLIRRGWIRH